MSPQKLGPKVLWQELSNRLDAVYLGDPVHVIPLQTAYLVAVDHAEVGYGLTAFLNSTPVRAYTAAFAERARGAYFRHFSWVIGVIPLPNELQTLLESSTGEPTLGRLLEVSQLLHQAPQRSDRVALVGEVDKIVAQLYGLTDEQLQSIQQFFAFITPSQALVGGTAVEETEETTE